MPCVVVPVALPFGIVIIGDRIFLAARRAIVIDQSSVLLRKAVTRRRGIIGTLRPSHTVRDRQGLRRGVDAAFVRVTAHPARHPVDVLPAKQANSSGSRRAKLTVLHDRHLAVRAISGSCRRTRQ